MLEHIGKAVLATDIEGKITYHNEAASQLLGIEEVEAKGRCLNTILKFQDETDGHEVLLPLEQAIQQDKLYNVDRGLLMVDGAGKIRQVTYTVSPLRNEAKVTVGAVVVLNGHSLKLNDLRNETETPPKELPDFFFVKKEGGFHRVSVEDVVYIEAMENYALMVTEKDRHTLHTTLKNLERKLGPLGFSRVHRSYIVPVNKIDLIEDNRLSVQQNTIPIGKSYKSALMERLYFV